MLATMNDAACPGVDELAAFAAAGLDPARRSGVEAHLGACEQCSTLVAAFLEGDDDPPADFSSAGEELEASAPRYRIHRLLGSGGMGAVYEAEEARTGRRVALKLVREVEGADRAASLRRFFREARIAALLEHPNIVPVFDLGEFPDGTPYYTQRLIVGRSLASAISNAGRAHGRLALVRHFRDLCDAVGYAHGRGVVHRDLKSTNVIVGLSGETWVIDWGLARVRRDAGPDGAAARDVFSGPVGEATSDPALTLAGTTVGTPSTMSPEQARGELELVDERSDVWSLGAVLLEILSGRPPFAGLGSSEVMSRLRAGKGPPVPPELANEVPPELVAIAKKALSPERARRYPSAVELAADVGAWMIGGAVSAHHYSSVERLRRSVRQHRVLSAAAAVALVVGAGWTWTVREANLRLREQRAAYLIERAQSYAYHLQFDRAAVDFASSLELHESVAARLGLAAAGEDAPRPLWKQPVPGSAIRALVFAEAKAVVSAGNDGLVSAWDVESGAELARRQMPGAIAALAACSLGQVALAVGSSARLWRPRGDEEAPPLAHPGPVRGVALSEKCDLLATAAADGVRVFRLPGGELAARFSSAGDAASVAFVPGGRLAWTIRDTVWLAPDALDPRRAPASLRLPQEIRSVSAAAGRMAILLAGGKVELVDLARPGGPRRAGEVRVVGPTSAAFLFPDGRSLALLDASTSLAFADAETGLLFALLASSSRPLFAVAASPDGRFFASGGEDRVLRIFEADRIRTYAGFHPPEGSRPTDLAWSPTGATLATSEEDGSIRLWDGERGTPRHRLGRHQGMARSLRFSPDGGKLASVGADGLRVWDLTGGPPAQLGGGPARALAWLPDGRRVAVGREDGAVEVMELSGAARRIEDAHRGPVQALAVSPDGRLLATGDRDGAVVVHDLAGGGARRMPDAHSERIGSLAFSRDGRLLASGGADRAIRLWDSATLAPAGELLVYGTGELVSLDFAPAGSPVRDALLAGYAQGRALLWEPAGHEMLLGLQTWITVAVSAARFSPDGRRVALLNSAGSLRLIPLEGGASLPKLMKLYKYRPEGFDVMRDEEALLPPVLRARR